MFWVDQLLLFYFHPLFRPLATVNHSFTGGLQQLFVFCCFPCARLHLFTNWKVMLSFLNERIKHHYPIQSSNVWLPENGLTYKTVQWGNWQMLFGFVQNTCSSKTPTLFWTSLFILLFICFYCLTGLNHFTLNTETVKWVKRCPGPI